MSPLLLLPGDPEAITGKKLTTSFHPCLGWMFIFQVSNPAWKC